MTAREGEPRRRGGRTVACPYCAITTTEDDLRVHLEARHQAGVLPNRRTSPRPKTITKPAGSKVLPEGRPQHALKKCPRCGVPVRQDRMAKHVRTVHDRQPSSIPRRVVSGGGSSEPESPSSTTSGFAVGVKLKTLRLESRRARTVTTGIRCSTCWRLSSIGYEYMKTNVGPVRLCGYCRGLVLSATGASSDAWYRRYR